MDTLNLLLPLQSIILYSMLDFVVDIGIDIGLDGANCFNCIIVFGAMGGVID